MRSLRCVCALVMLRVCVVQKDVCVLWEEGVQEESE